MSIRWTFSNGFFATERRAEFLSIYPSVTGIQRGSMGSLEQTCRPGATVLKILPTLPFASENVAEPVSALDDTLTAIAYRSW
jgi:hypothetical protein